MEDYIIFTKHAKQRMLEREINMKMCIEVFEFIGGLDVYIGGLKEIWETY